MADSFVASTSIAIDAKAEKVWNALVNPDLIRQYLYGTQAISEWKVGSPIVYRGEWEGKHYEDKGTILELIPNKSLVTSYWSSFSGREDKPENYLRVSCHIAEAGGESTLTITTENNPSREAADQAASNWATVLGTLKKLLEK
ncbi:MAG: SRPBCC domain-containing protein [Rectinemataceae bacterium]